MIYHQLIYHIILRYRVLLMLQIRHMKKGKTLAKGLIMLDPLGRLADEVVVVPYDMIAIPAHEYFRMNSDPTFQIYIRGGETIMPTGGNVRDVQEAVEMVAVQDTPKRKKKTTCLSTQIQESILQLA